MSRDVFDLIEELEGVKLAFNADELLLLLLDATQVSGQRGFLTFKEQKIIMAVVASVIDAALKEPEQAKEKVEAAKLAVQETQRIAHVLHNKSPEEALKVLTKMILDKANKD